MASRARRRRVVGAEALGRALLEGLGEGREERGRHRRAGVLDAQHARARLRVVWIVTVPPAGRLWTIAFSTRFVTTRDRSAGDQRSSPLAGDLDRDPAVLGEREQPLGHLLDEQREVDGLMREGSLVGAAEHEQRFGEVDRSALTAWRRARSSSVTAVLRATSSSVCVIASGCAARGRRCREPTLLGDVGFELREHGVEGVRQLAELVVGPSRSIRCDSEPFAARRVASVIRLSGASMRPARNHPPSSPKARRNSRPRRPRARSRSGVAAVRQERPEAGDPVGDVAQEQHPHDREQQAARDHQEPGVAEGRA